MKISESTERRILFIFLIILLIGLVILLWLISKQIDQAKEEVGRTELASVTETASSSAENIQVTYSLVSNDDSDAAKDVANRFMLAKLQRNYDEAKPFMTEDLKSKITQESFAGTSSPSMDRFEITSTSKKEDKVYLVEVISYWKLNGEDADTLKYSIELEKQDSGFLVNKFN